MFFKRKALEAFDFIDPNFMRFEDYHTWIKLTKVGYRIFYYPEPLVYWRRHQGSISYTVWQRSDALYKINELEVFKRYVMPDIMSLPFVYQLHVISHVLYLKTLLFLGVSRKNHKIAGLWKCLDPFWLRVLPQKILSGRKKIFKK